MTTIRGINTPSDSDKLGRYACSSRSTIVTNPAITTIYDAMRILLGITFRSAEMAIFEQIRMIVTETPMPMPLNSVVVMAIVEHMPSSCASTGF